MASCCTIPTLAATLTGSKSEGEATPNVPTVSRLGPRCASVGPDLDPEVGPALCAELGLAGWDGVD